jgi:hypothetical protein
MKITPPNEDELLELELEHEHRYPEKAAIEVPGEGGKLIRLPLLLGIPSGACKMPDGEKPSRAWQKAVAITLRKMRDEDTAPLLRDCILWPSRKVWAEWCERWPAMHVQAYHLVRDKFGGALTMLEQPGEREEAPAPIAAAIAAHPNGVWRRLAPRRDAKFDVVIAPPDPISWKLYMEGLGAEDANFWESTLDMVKASVVAIDGTARIGAADIKLSFDAVIARWPGQAMLTIAIVGHLAGVAARTELGNW